MESMNSIKKQGNDFYGMIGMLQSVSLYTQEYLATLYIRVKLVSS